MARDMPLALTSLIEPHESLASHIPFVTALDDQTLILRDGDLMTSFAVDGLSAETLDQVDVASLSDVFAKLVAQQYGDVGFYIHRLSTRTEPDLSPVRNGNGFSEKLDRIWQGYIQSAGLRQRTVIVTLTLRPSKITSLFGKLTRSRKKSVDVRMQKRIQRINEITESFIEIAASAKPRRLTVSNGEWLGLLRAILTGIYDPIKPGRKFIPFCEHIATSPIHFKGDEFTIFGAHEGQTRLGTMLTLKDYPANTHAGILDMLDLGIDMCVTNSFTPMDPVTAQEDIRRVIRQMSVADDAAISLQAQLTDALDDVASGRVAFGKHHCTIALYADSEDQLDDHIATVQRIVTSTGGSVLREGFSARAAYFAQIPGNYTYRTRASTISSINFSHLGALHGASRGRPQSRSPWGDAITLLPTANGEVYRFNFHQAGKYGERTVGHSLILGMTNSGKTLGTAFLLAQAQRLRPRIIVFDKDRGMEMPVRAMGGAYSSVQMGVKTGFNPFASESDERGSAWLSDWLESLLKPKDGELSPLQIEALAKAASENSKAPLNLQTLRHFRTQLRAVDDQGDLYQRLGRWDQGGQYDWLFGGQGTDSLTFDADVTAFDMTEIFDADLIRTAWLSYVFRRIERVVEDERPTLIVLDEAWKLLDDDYFRDRLKDWMLTMRKKNVALVLLTQRVSHITQSAAGGSILESVTTRLLYPSNKTTEEELAPLKLTENELNFALQSNEDHRLALLQSGDDSSIIDMDLSALGPLLKVLGGGKGETAPDGWRNDPEFWKGMKE